MHMADALLAPAVAATIYAASAVTVGASVKTLKKDEATDKLPTMAVTSALVFAGQMINYTGSSGHLCGGIMKSPFTDFIKWGVFFAKEIPPRFLSAGYNKIIEDKTVV